MSSAASSEEPESFVTVIIEAHGSDLKQVRADPEQNATLRKLTVAGKCGNLVPCCGQMDESLFRVTAALAREDRHSTSAKKLQIVREYMRDPIFSFPDALQHKFVVNLPEVFARVNPKESDWFSVSKVKYDHSYAYTVNDESNPWERRDFGLWFADGSLRAQKIAGFRHDGGPSYRCDILEQIIDPAILPEEGKFFNFKITMFELAERIKKKYGVKIVNFIDISCRNVPPPNYPRLKKFVRGTRRLLGLPTSDSSDLSEGGLSPVAQRASPDRPTIISFDGRNFEVHEVPAIRGLRTPDIPDGWIYGKFIDTDLAYYINPTERRSISQSDWDVASFRKVKSSLSSSSSSLQPWKKGGKPRRTFKTKNKRKSKCGKICKGNNKSMRRSTMKQKHRRRNKY
jgi:hypothetical protein